MWPSHTAPFGGIHRADPVLTTASAAALGHVLDVLLENALRHGSGDITLLVDRIGRGARLQISDRGRIDAPRTVCSNGGAPASRAPASASTSPAA